MSAWMIRMYDHAVTRPLQIGMGTPIGSRRGSEPQMLVALPALASIAVMPAMSTKSRQVIYGSRIEGASIRAGRGEQRGGTGDEAGSASISLAIGSGTSRRKRFCQDGPMSCGNAHGHDRQPRHRRWLGKLCRPTIFFATVLFRVQALRNVF